MKKEKRYLLPDTLNPGSAVCIRVYVPDDPLYIAAFWGSYEHLTKWLAWESDPAHRGAIAAAVWMPWFRLARNQWLLGVTCADLPDDPIYPDTDGADEVTDFIWWIYQTVLRIDQLITDGAQGIAETVADEVYADSGVYIGTVIGGLVTYLETLTESERDTAISSIDWEDMRDTVHCQNLTTYEDHRHWLDLLADDIYQWLTDAASDITTALSAMVQGITGIYGGPAITQLAESTGGGGAGFGFGDPACQFSHTWDFRESPGGWDADYDSSFDTGEWVEGEGWACRIKHGTSWYRCLKVYRPFFPERYITSWSMTFEVEKGSFSNPGGTYLYYSALNRGSVLGTTMGEVASAISNGEYTKSRNNSALADGIYVRILCSQAATQAPAESGWAYLRSVTINGIGLDPFK